MNNFKEGGFKKRDNNSGGHRKGGFGGGRDRDRDRDSRPMQKFSATCASCQKSCEVPFRPSGDKPVYCSDCFGKRSQNDSFGGQGNDKRDRGSSHSHHDARPGQAAGRSRDADAEIKKRLTIIESRLNRILDLINPATNDDGSLHECKTAKKKEERKAEKEEKKLVDKPELKKVVAKAVKEAAPKKVAKKTVVKKVIKKTTPKKVVVKKVAVKKVVKKIAKKPKK